MGEDALSKIPPDIDKNIVSLFLFISDAIKNPTTVDCPRFTAEYENNPSLTDEEMDDD